MYVYSFISNIILIALPYTDFIADTYYAQEKKKTVMTKFRSMTLQ